MDLMIDETVSTEERLLVAAIRCDPVADSRYQSRLVYADWLEERGLALAADAQRRLVRHLRIVERYRRGHGLLENIPSPQA